MSAPVDLLSDDLHCDCCDASWPVPADADIDAAEDEAIGAGWGLSFDGETCLCPRCRVGGAA